MAFVGRCGVIVIKLKEAMLAYGRRSGARLTYEDVSDMTGIPTETLRSIGGRPGYHCSVARIEVLCRALEMPLHDMLEMIDDPPKRKRTTKKKKRA
jgi:DNA-binding Xre family transcriptional regulator